MTRPFTVALVGYGQAATLLHAAFAAEREVAFRWVIGRLPGPAEHFARERGIPCHGADLEHALHDDQVDAVIIATPHDLHYAQALRTLQAGKHAIVEVPLTMSYTEAQALVRVAAAHGRHLSAPLIARYLPMNVEARRLIEAGELGRVFQFIYRRLWLQRRIGHLLNRARSWIDTVAWHHAAHPVDLAMWLLGDRMACVGAVIGYDREHGNAVDLSANFVTSSGAAVTLTLSYNATQNFLDGVVVGEKALLEMEGFSCLKRQGEVLLAPQEALDVQRLAYQRYCSAALAGMRDEGPMPLTGAELLPTIEQLQRIHDLAGPPQSFFEEVPLAVLGSHATIDSRGPRRTSKESLW